MGEWGVCASVPICILGQEIFSSNFLKSYPHFIVSLLILGCTVSLKSKIHASSSRGLKWLIIILAGFLGTPQCQQGSPFPIYFKLTALALVSLKQGSDSHSFKWFSSVPSASQNTNSHSNPIKGHAWFVSQAFASKNSGSSLECRICQTSSLEELQLPLIQLKAPLKL